MAGEAAKKTNEEQNTEIADDFSKAFADLAKLSDEPDSQIKTTGAADPAAATAAADPTPEEKAVAEKAAADEAAAAAAAAGGAKPAEEPVGDLPDPNSPEGKIAADEAAAAAAAGGDKTKPPVTPKPAEPDRLDAAIEKLAERLTPKPAPQVREQPKPAPMFTPEEVTVVQSYLTEFPDIAKAEEIIRRVEQRQIVAYVFNQFEQRLAAQQAVIEELAGRTFKEDLTKGAPDYDPTQRDKIIAWIGEQPAYLQAGYNHVVEEGTAEEVIDLINRYKAATGTKPATPPVKETELPTPAKKAVASLAPVGSKRTGTAAAGIAKDDFEGAFKEAAAAAET